jgi:hypothetical protein
VADAEDSRRARVVPPFQLQPVHEENLRNPQHVRERIDLDSGQSRELRAESDWRELAVDVPLARWNSDVLFDCDHFLP